MEANVKPGTRCECRSSTCPHDRELDEAGQKRGDPDAFRCRLVGVKAVEVLKNPEAAGRIKIVRMCVACANHASHEVC